MAGEQEFAREQILQAKGYRDKLVCKTLACYVPSILSFPIKLTMVKTLSQKTVKSCYLAEQVLCIFKASTWEAEAGGSLRIQRQSGPHSAFQDSQRHTVTLSQQTYPKRLPFVLSLDKCNYRKPVTMSEPGVTCICICGHP